MSEKITTLSPDVDLRETSSKVGSLSSKWKRPLKELTTKDGHAVLQGLHNGTQVDFMTQHGGMFNLSKDADFPKLNWHLVRDIPIFNKSTFVTSEKIPVKDPFSRGTIFTTCSFIGVNGLTLDEVNFDARVEYPKEPFKWFKASKKTKKISSVFENCANLTMCSCEGTNIYFKDLSGSHTSENKIEGCVFNSSTFEDSYVKFSNGSLDNSSIRHCYVKSSHQRFFNDFFVSNEMCISDTSFSACRIVDSEWHTARSTSFSNCVFCGNYENMSHYEKGSVEKAFLDVTFYDPQFFDYSFEDISFINANFKLYNWTPMCVKFSNCKFKGVSIDCSTLTAQKLLEESVFYMCEGVIIVNRSEAIVIQPELDVDPQIVTICEQEKSNNPFAETAE